MDGINWLGYRPRERAIPSMSLPVSQIHDRRVSRVHRGEIGHSEQKLGTEAAGSLAFRARNGAVSGRSSKRGDDPRAVA